ncbi:MAG: hypothetical protein KC591_07340 [Gemmatimonadetes bacterium]|nr:hypothetical protein [Gemmatimonadota bacterium]
MSEQILRSLALASMLALLVAGPACLTLPDSSTDEDTTGQDKFDDPGDSTSTPDTTTAPVPTAYFLFQAADLRSPEWPDAFRDYDLLVCNPSMPPSDLATIRAEMPEVLLIADTNVQDIRLGYHAGNPYFDALTAAFDSSWCIRDFDTGELIGVLGYDGTPGSGVPAWIPLGPSIEALVAFHRDVTMASPWDGFYVDQCTEVYPPWRQAIILEQTLRFDYDGDGNIDRMDDLLVDYATGRARFTQRLREVLGPDVLLVGNAGGHLADPALNGICLEGVGERFTVQQARDILDDAEAVSPGRWIAPLWVTADDCVEATEQLSQEHPGVHYGVVDYFTPSPPNP